MAKSNQVTQKPGCSDPTARCCAPGVRAEVGFWTIVLTVQVVFNTVVTWVATCAALAAR